MLNSELYLIHSSKGTTWTKKDHKWIKRIPSGNGYRYIYNTSARVSGFPKPDDSAEDIFLDLDDDEKEKVSEFKDAAEDFRYKLLFEDTHIGDYIYATPDELIQNGVDAVKKMFSKENDKTKKYSKSS